MTTKGGISRAAIRPSRYFLNRLRKLTNPSKISDKLCRWGKAKAFLDTVGGNGGKQKSGPLAEIRLTTPFQSGHGTRKGSPGTNSVVPSSSSGTLSRSRQTGRVRRNDSSTNTKAVYSRDVGNRARFLFSGISGPQKVGGGGGGGDS